MSAKPYWNLLVLFSVVSQGIIGTFAEKDIDESSELLVRQKRVINRSADIKVPIRNAPYVVTVKELSSRESCVGVILSNHIVLTAAKCVDFEIVLGRVFSGSARKTSNPSSSHFVKHSITDKKVRIPNPLSSPRRGIALITITPYFVYSVNTRNILLAEGHNQHGLNGTVSGWGCNAIGHPGTEHPDYLRSITVPIITNSECARLYGSILQILDSDICTYDTNGYQYCGHTDAGAPLVIKDGHNIDKLTGILIRSGIAAGRASPDIFANVQHPIYRNWIADNIRSLNLNHHT